MVSSETLVGEIDLVGVAGGYEVFDLDDFLRCRPVLGMLRVMFWG